MKILNSAGLFQCLAFGCDALQQIVPGLIERLGPFKLELNAKGVDVDARPAEAVQHLLTVPAIRRQQVLWSRLLLARRWTGNEQRRGARLKPVLLLTGRQ